MSNIGNAHHAKADNSPPIQPCQPAYCRSICNMFAATKCAHLAARSPNV